MQEEVGWLEIGTIVSAQGLKGELRVYPDSDFPERFLEPGSRWILPKGQTEPQEVELVQGRQIPGKALYVIRLAGIDDRDQAEALQGAKLLVPETDRPLLEEGEYHVLDLIGLAVIDQATGNNIGIVVDVLSTGHDSLEVQLHPEATPSPEMAGSEHAPPVSAKALKPKKVLIPFVEAIVPVVDLEAGRVEITPPPGLLDLASS